MHKKGIGFGAVVFMAIVALLSFLIGCVQTPQGKMADLTVVLPGGGNIFTQQVLPVNFPIETHHFDITVTHDATGVQQKKLGYTGTTAQFLGLAPGAYTVDVIAYNSDSAVLGDGTAPATVTAGLPSTVSIQLVPLAGIGTLEQHIKFGAYVDPVSSDGGPLAGKMYRQGSSVPEHDFLYTVADNGDGTKTASCTTQEDNGWVVISMQAFDAAHPDSTPGHPVLDSGLADIALIVKDQLTICNWLLPISGGFVVNIVPHLYYKLNTELSGVPDTFVRFSDPFTATLNVPGYSEGDCYVTFYLDGALMQEGTSWSYIVPNSVGKADGKPGFRLDVVAYTIADGGLGAGSTYKIFNVVY